jgi:hypoxanthine phosphoribosyltransferase
MTTDLKHIQMVWETATCLYDQSAVETTLNNIANELTNDYQNRDPLVLCVVKGGIIFAGNLLTRLPFLLELDYVHVTRYKGGTRGGELQWIKRPNQPFKDRHVLILDDILDGGLTLAALIHSCEDEGAASVASAVLVDKNVNRHPQGLAKADYTALTVPNQYIFGYGMDYHDYLRNANGIYAVKEDLI